MYLTLVKTAVVEALRSTFTTTYPNADFRTPMVSIEYPVEQVAYPGIWVQYEDRPDSLHIAGIGHQEAVTNGSGTVTGYQTRWRFAGEVTVSCVALSSQERDRLFDEVVRTFAFAKYNTYLAAFRGKIETNDLIGMNANFDDLRPFGDAASPGTPWGTDEIIYEKSVSFDLQGEFLGDATTGTLVPLSKVTYLDYADGATEPLFPDEAGSTTAPPTPGDWDRTSWH